MTCVPPKQGHINETQPKALRRYIYRSPFEPRAFAARVGIDTLLYFPLKIYTQKNFNKHLFIIFRHKDTVYIK